VYLSHAKGGTKKMNKNVLFIRDEVSYKVIKVPSQNIPDLLSYIQNKYP